MSKLLFAISWLTNRSFQTSSVNRLRDTEHLQNLISQTQFVFSKCSGCFMSIVLLTILHDKRIVPLPYIRLRIVKDICVLLLLPWFVSPPSFYEFECPFGSLGITTGFLCL